MLWTDKVLYSQVIQSVYWGYIWSYIGIYVICKLYYGDHGVMIQNIWRYIISSFQVYYLQIYNVYMYVDSLSGALQG